MNKLDVHEIQRSTYSEADTATMPSVGIFISIRHNLTTEFSVCRSNTRILTTQISQIKDLCKIWPIITSDLNDHLIFYLKLSRIANYLGFWKWKPKSAKYLDFPTQELQKIPDFRLPSLNANQISWFLQPKPQLFRQEPSEIPKQNKKENPLILTQTSQKSLLFPLQFKRLFQERNRVMPKPLTFLLRASVSPKPRQSSDFYPSQKPRKTKESPVSEAKTPRNSKNPQISIARERPKPQNRSFSQILHRIERFEIASNSRTNSILSSITLSLSLLLMLLLESEKRSKTTSYGEGTCSCRAIYTDGTNGKIVNKTKEEFYSISMLPFPGAINTLLPLSFCWILALKREFCTVRFRFP